MLTVVRRNKSFKKRKLAFYEGKKLITYVEPFWGWIAHTEITDEKTYKEIRSKVMENLYWLLGHECDFNTWAESINNWNKGRGVNNIDDNISMFHNSHEMAIALDSFYDGYYKED